jgi:hypothetical protein
LPGRNAIRCREGIIEGIALGGGKGASRGNLLSRRHAQSRFQPERLDRKKANRDIHGSDVGAVIDFYLSPVGNINWPRGCSWTTDGGRLNGSKGSQGKINFDMHHVRSSCGFSEGAVSEECMAALAIEVQAACYMSKWKPTGR